MRELITTVGNTSYYVREYMGQMYLEVDDFQTIKTRKFLGIFGKGFKDTITKRNTYLMGIPLYSLFSLFSNVEPTGKVVETFDGRDIDTYDTISTQDNYQYKKDLKKMYDINIEVLGGVSKLDFTLTPKNEVVKGFIKEGFHDYVVDLENVIFRTYYTYKTTLGGVLNVAMVKEVGNYTDRENAVTTHVNTLMIDRDVVVAIVSHIDAINEKNNKENAE